MAEDLLAQLLSPDGGQVWSQFLFNIPLGRSLGNLTEEAANAVLAAGHRWNGAGWTTSRASRVLYELIGIPLVSSQVDAYRDSWLFSLSIIWNVEAVALNLCDRSAEAAYALAGLLCAEDPADTQAEDQREAQQEEPAEAAEEEEIPVPVLAWDEVLDDMPPELLLI